MRIFVNYEKRLEFSESIWGKSLSTEVAEGLPINHIQVHERVLHTFCVAMVTRDIIEYPVVDFVEKKQQLDYLNQVTVNTTNSYNELTEYYKKQGGEEHFEDLKHLGIQVRQLVDIYKDLKSTINA